MLDFKNNYELYVGDCLEIMNKLIEKGVKVDAIITDIPYGTTACKWDSVVPLADMWDKLNKISKDNTPIILFSSQPFTSKLVSSNVKNYREEIIWLKNKGGSGLQAKQKHIKIHENIIGFSKSGKYTYNPQKWEVKEKEFLTQRKTMSIYGESNNIYGNLKRNRKPDDGTRNPISIIPFKVPITPAKTKIYDDSIDVRVHETQKPILLMEYLVKTYSNENDIVLDFTMGSGTTGVATLKLNRKFIGIEKDDTYFNMAKERINQVMEDKK